MRRTESILTPTVKMQALTLRIDAALRDRLKALDERIAKEAPRLAFDRTQVVQAALERAVEAANAELDSLAKERANGRA